MSAARILLTPSSTGAYHRKKFRVPLMELILGTARFQGQKPINGNVVQNRVWVFFHGILWDPTLGI